MDMLSNRLQLFLVVKLAANLIRKSFNLKFTLLVFLMCGAPSIISAASNSGLQPQTRIVEPEQLNLGDHNTVYEQPGRISDLKVGKATRLVGQTIEEAKPLSEGTKQRGQEYIKSSSFILALDLSKMNFDDQVLRGEVTNWGWTIGYALNPRFEMGYSSSSNFLNSWDEEDVITSINMFFLRGNFPLGKKITGFALIGRSQVKIKTDESRVCYFFCGEAIALINTTTYRNKQSGMALGLGLQWQGKSPHRYWMLKYIDYLDTGFEFKGVHLGYRAQFAL